MAVSSLFRNKHGVSEIIASLILILIVSAAGVLAYSISLTAFSSSTSNFQLQVDQREAKATERLASVGGLVEHVEPARAVELDSSELRCNRPHCGQGVREWNAGCNVSEWKRSQDRPMECDICKVRFARDY